TAHAHTLTLHDAPPIWLQRRLREVERQFALERERSRIARDIHDDLGANLTQIGLLSALGAAQSDDPAQSRARFEAIGATSGELRSEEHTSELQSRENLV